MTSDLLRPPHRKAQLTIVMDEELLQRACVKAGSGARIRGVIRAFLELWSMDAYPNLPEETVVAQMRRAQKIPRTKKKKRVFPTGRGLVKISVLSLSKDVDFYRMVRPAYHPTHVKWGILKKTLTICWQNNVQTCQMNIGDDGNVCYVSSVSVGRGESRRCAYSRVRLAFFESELLRN